MSAGRPNLPQLLGDAEKLLSVGYNAISSSPLEIYSLALLLSSSDTLLFTRYLHELEETKRRLGITLNRVEEALLR